IYLNNHVSSQPIYDEHGRSNIIYDVDLVGGVPGEFSNVDLEVYLAVDDDEEYASLPEAELAIEGEAYERCFGDEGAIDVHIPGAEIFFFNGIEESDEAEQHHHQESCHEELLRDAEWGDELEELMSSGSETCSEEE
ncbi:Ribosome bioproteinsis protein, partial [Epichloe bromicola]